MTFDVQFHKYEHETPAKTVIIQQNRPLRHTAYTSDFSFKAIF